MREYTISCGILAGIDNQLVWEGTIELFANSKSAAKKLALKILEGLTEFDERIDPGRRIFEIVETGEVLMPPPAKVSRKGRAPFEVDLETL